MALLPFCKIFWNNLVLMCNICKSVVIKLLLIILNIILYVLNEHGYMDHVWSFFTHKWIRKGHCVILGLRWIMLLCFVYVGFWIELLVQMRLCPIFVKIMDPYK